MFGSAKQDWRGDFLSILKVRCGSAVGLVYDEGKGKDDHVVQGSKRVKTVVDMVDKERHSRFEKWKGREVVRTVGDI